MIQAVVQAVVQAVFGMMWELHLALEIQVEEDWDFSRHRQQDSQVEEVFVLAASSVVSTDPLALASAQILEGALDRN